MRTSVPGRVSAARSGSMATRKRGGPSSRSVTTAAPGPATAPSSSRRAPTRPSKGARSTALDRRTSTAAMPASASASAASSCARSSEVSSTRCCVTWPSARRVCCRASVRRASSTCAASASGRRTGVRDRPPAGGCRAGRSPRPATPRGLRGPEPPRSCRPPRSRAPPPARFELAGEPPGHDQVIDDLDAVGRHGRRRRGIRSTVAALRADNMP
jgi:hypothetical protein